MSEHHKFKVGDRLRCHSTSGANDVIVGNPDGPWTVSGFVGGFWLLFEESGDLRNDPKRFEPAWEKAVRGWEPMDPYTAHRLSRSDATARELTDARVGNVEARKKLVAALANELDRPAPVRFPHVGRNFALEKKL